MNTRSSLALSDAQRAGLRLAQASWLALALLCVLWEWQLAPIRPGGSWLMLKVLPLLVLARGLLRADVDAFQWALLVVLLYAAEGSVRVFDPMPVRLLAWLEIVLAVVFFAAAVVYVRPFKQAAKRARQEGGTAAQGHTAGRADGSEP